MAEGNRFFDGTIIQYFSGDDISQQSDDFVRYIETRLLGLHGIKPTDLGNAGGTPAEIATFNAYTKYETQLKGHFASFLLSGAHEWYKEWIITHAADDWQATMNAFIIEFNTERNKYYAQTEAKEIAMKPQEHITQFFIRVKKLCSIGWHGETVELMELKIREIFLDGLPQDLRNKAQDRIITQPAITNIDLVKHIEQKAVSRAISSRQSLNASANIENTLNLVMQELKELKTTAVNVAAYDPNKPRYKQNPQRFCKFCRKSGHTVEYCIEKRQQTENNRPQGRPNAQMRFAQFYPTNGTNSTQPQGQFRPRNPPPQHRPRFNVPVRTSFQPQNSRFQNNNGRQPDNSQRNENGWGFNYPPWKRNTGNPLIDNYSFRHRLDNGWGPPKNWSGNQNQIQGTKPKSSQHANRLQSEQQIEETQNYSANMCRIVMPNSNLN